MKTNQIRFTLVAILFGLLSITVIAQDELKNSSMKKYFYLQPNAGISQYFGDLNENKYWNEDPKFAFGAILGYRISSVYENKFV